MDARTALRLLLQDGQNEVVCAKQLKKSLEQVAESERLTDVKPAGDPANIRRNARLAQNSPEGSLDAQLKFLFAAIQDAQSTIRATDAKITALSFGLAVPITKLGSIWSVSSDLLGRVHGFGKFCAALTVLIFAMAWIVSISAALRTLFHVDNPARHVGGDHPTGIFYSPVLFQVSLFDVFFPRRLDSSVQFSSFFERLPIADEDVRRELAFEFMKLVYIRTIKLKRASVTYSAFSAWLLTGGGIWVLSLYLRAHGS